MAEARGDEELAPVLRRELHRGMVAEGGRADADVDGDVEDAAAHDAHQLVLGEGRALEMDPAQRARPRRRARGCPG